jgi:hypothetical protein
MHEQRLVDGAADAGAFNLRMVSQLTPERAAGSCNDQPTSWRASLSFVPVTRSGSKRGHAARRRRLAAATAHDYSDDCEVLEIILPAECVDTGPMWRRAASYVAKILRGAQPADLPVEQATNFEFALNLKTAKAIGVTLPTSILLRADEVIE